MKLQIFSEKLKNFSKLPHNVLDRGPVARTDLPSLITSKNDLIESNYHYTRDVYFGEKGFLGYMVCHWLFAEHGWNSVGSVCVEIAEKLGVNPNSPYQ